jgi:hypothetical protein
MIIGFTGKLKLEDILFRDSWVTLHSAGKRELHAV